MSRMTDELDHDARMNRLEEIVRTLEAGGLDLDATLALFEEGQGLLTEARKSLEAAEGRLAKLSLEEAESA